MRRRLSTVVLLMFLLSIPVLNAGGGADVQLGASPKQVFSILGKPMGSMSKGARTTWMYAGGSVVFEGNKVIETTFKDRREKVARSKALLEAGKQNAAARSHAGAEQMRKVTRPAQAIAVPVQAPQVKTSDEYETARADAAVKLTAAKARREEALGLAKEALTVAEREAKKEAVLDEAASVKKQALALRAYDAEAKRIDVVYQAELAQINQIMKSANARYVLFMAAQARLAKERQDQQQKRLRELTGSFQPVVRKTVAYKKLAPGGTKCPTCGKPVVAPTGKVVMQSGKRYRIYECVVGHECMGE